jgi:hypothetical protein
MMICDRIQYGTILVKKDTRRTWMGVRKFDEKRILRAGNYNSNLTLSIKVMNLVSESVSIKHLIAKIEGVL